MGTPVIDFHIHLGTEGMWTPAVKDSLVASAGPAADETMEAMRSPEKLDQMLEAKGIDLAVAMAAESPLVTGNVPNAWVADFCRRSQRVVPFLCINPMTMPSPAREVERLARDLGARGLKLYPTYQGYYPNDRRMYPVYAKAEESGLPVTFHTGSSVFKGSRLKYGDPLYLDDVAVDFPDLKIVMAHSGRPIWYNTAALLARLHENVYMEISGLRVRKLLENFPDLERLADKVIFGSDWPEVDARLAIARIRALPLKEETKRKILGGTAARVLGLRQSSQ